MFITVLDIVTFAKVTCWVKFALPTTWRVCPGDVVPMPTLYPVNILEPETFHNPIVALSPLVKVLLDMFPKLKSEDLMNCV